MPTYLRRTKRTWDVTFEILDDSKYVHPNGKLYTKEELRKAVRQALENGFGSGPTKGSGVSIKYVIVSDPVRDKIRDKKYLDKIADTYQGGL